VEGGVCVWGGGSLIHYNEGKVSWIDNRREGGRKGDSAY
jgi:hypothetical protein